ncbi:MAG: PH domain-containing protein [Acidobacteria bacterium]|nr:PH domain-containing protein [Acidobacteriota bacterium]MBI3656853.1 PH domain-containing protein [Acidobacteriota bacterium]
MAFTSEHLQTGEEIIAAANPHMITLSGPIVTVLAGLVLCIVGAVLSKPSLPNGPWWFLLAWLPFLLYLLWKIKVRTSEQYIITTHRVIKHEGIFTKSSFDASLDKINNIFYSQTVAGRLLKYGSVGLETASEDGTTYFSYIPNPIRFKNIILEAREEYLRRRNQPIALKEDIPAMLEKLGKLRADQVISEEEFQESKKKLLGKL